MYAKYDRIKIMKSPKNTVLLFILVFSLVALSFLSLSLGAVHIKISEIIDCFFFSAIDSPKEKILRFVRLPRIIACIAGGAGLACAGSIIQSVLRNPLGSPNIIGVNSGAGFALSIASVLLPSSVILFPVVAFIGSLITVFLVYALGLKSGSSKYAIILSGVVVNTLFSALSDAMQVFFPDTIFARSAFRIGSFASVMPKILYPAAILIVIALAVSFLLKDMLDVLSLGDEVASSLGVNVPFARGSALIIAALLSGASVSFSGLLGFVGLIVPHIVRSLVGNEMGVVLPFSALCGSLLVLLCDLIARTAFSPYEVPVGIFLALLGCPFFMFLLLNKKKSE